MALDAHGAQSLQSCFDLHFAVFKCIFIYLFTHRGRERGGGTCAQHASHFDLAYDREFFFLRSREVQGGARRAAGNVISINLIFDNCVCREALMEL